MMIRYTPIIVFVFISFAVSAQQKITGLVEDDETGSPVSYASITSEKGDVIVTDSAGNFSFVIRRLSRPNDSILVTAIGYSSKRVAVKDLLRNNQIKLTQKYGMLEQVKVFASLKGDYRKFGYYREWKVKNEGGEIGYIFDLPKNKIQLGKVQVKINHNYDTCWLKLHLRDAAVSSSGLPENEVLTKEVILPTTIKYGLVEFDLNWEAVNILQTGCMLVLNSYVAVVPNQLPLRSSLWEMKKGLIFIKNLSNPFGNAEGNTPFMFV